MKINRYINKPVSSLGKNESAVEEAFNGSLDNCIKVTINLVTGGEVALSVSKFASIKWSDEEDWTTETKHTMKHLVKKE